MTTTRFISAALDGSGRLVQDDAPGVQLPWWSFTKTVLSACVLMRAGEGFLDLDAPMPGRKFTLRHLMAHTSGLKDYAGVGRYRSAVEAGETPWSPKQLMEEVGADDMLWAPEKGWRYSNVGYMLLRFALEVSEGADLGTIVARRIAKPLGLKTVRLALTPEDFDAIPWDSHGYHPGWVYHGCLIGSAADASKTLHGLLNGLLTEDQLDQMMTLHMQAGAIRGRIWNTTGYGLGLMIGQTDNGPGYGHAGCGPFSGNLVAHFADRDMTVASFCAGADEAPAEWEASRIARG